MDSFGQQLGDQAKQAVEAATIEPLKGLGKAAVAVVKPTQTSKQGTPADQIAQEDAAKLAVARRKLAEFNARLEQTYQKTAATQMQEKQMEEQTKQEERMQKQSDKQRAQDEAMRQAQRGGGTEGSREAK